MQKRRRKADLQEILSSMRSAVSEILAHQDMGIEDKLAILSGCQEAAIAVGNYLESYYEGTEAIIGILEGYCENIYQMSEAMGDAFLSGKLAQDMEQQIELVEQAVWRDLPADKKEVVFFPYKASMWDSLESIWKAAVADEKCDVYVVPIPYFDKKPDGSLGKGHYEGAEFPESVPIVDWREYTLAERKPDVAYIHNPYDDNNYVTSVHPGFYAQEIKKHVGKMVYCPYFVTAERIQDHFCSLPGVLWADKVIVQSEDIRKQYMQYYDEEVSLPHLRRLLGNSEDKFVALGSPKVDAVLFYDMEQVMLPKPWEKLCKDKCIVFYNTHLAEALTEGQIFLEKLKNVLTYFEQNEQYVLWWRPHPLSAETMAAMRPELLEEYAQIVKEYCEKAYGIYDDTALWYRAVAWADIYYGSGGSLRPLFGITGKPIISQNTRSMVSTTECCDVRYQAVTKAGDMIYLLSAELGALVSLNVLTEEWKLETMLPMELQGEISPLSRLFVRENKVYIFIVNANAHAVYDLDKKQFEIIEWKIGDRKPEPNEFVKWADVIEYEQYFIMIPFRFEAILVYNRENGEVVSYKHWLDLLKVKIKGFRKANYYFRVFSACVVKDHMFAVLHGNNKDVVCRFSLSDMCLEKVYPLPIEGEIHCLEYDGEHLWMIHDFGRGLLRWDYQKNKLHHYRSPMILEDVNLTQYHLYAGDTNICMYPIRKNRNLLHLTNNGLEEDMVECYQVSSWKTKQEVIVLQHNKPMLEWKTSDWITQRSFELQIPRECMKSEYKNELMHKRLTALMADGSQKYVAESSILQFNDWLDFLMEASASQWNREVAKQKYISLFAMESQSAGSLIHNYIMKDLED